MSKTKKTAGSAKVAGWCAQAIAYRASLEALSAAVSNYHAAPTPPNRFRLNEANDHALATLLNTADDPPLLIRPFLFGAHPVVLADSKAVEHWPLHLFPLEDGRVALRLGETLLVFSPEGHLVRTETALAQDSPAKADLAREHASGASSAGVAPATGYFAEDTPGGEAERASWEALKGRKVGQR